MVFECIYKKKRGTVAAPHFKAFALPLQVKQQPKSTPYVLKPHIPNINLLDSV